MPVLACLSPSLPLPAPRAALLALLWAAALLALPMTAAAQSSAPPAPGAAPDGSAAAVPAAELHGQFTTVVQYHPAFTSPYRGANSLDPGNSGRETADLTLFGGLPLWHGAALYVNPEIDQGFGLDGTLGAAGFPSGEAYKVGARRPYFRLPRAFLRQVIALAGDGAPVDAPSAANQLAGTQPPDNVTLTVGKFSVVDVFDNNAYAHDPRGDFLNWSIIDAGAFDYPADAWAFTYGAAAEWTQAWWTLRGGLFALSQQPNSKDIDGTFHQFGLLAEAEERHTLGGHPGRLRVLGFLNRGRMGRYGDAVALAQADGGLPDTARVRRYASRPGGALGLEQELGVDLGAFARLSANEGAQEAFEFTEINASASAGLSLAGARWRRPDDHLGAAVAVNAMSSAAQRYFAAGGLGILIGDGQLPHYGREKVFETYYAAAFGPAVTVSADLQRIIDPAYNRDRGPVTLAALRLHAQF